MHAPAFLFNTYTYTIPVTHAHTIPIPVTYTYTITVTYTIAIPFAIPITYTVALASDRERDRDRIVCACVTGIVCANGIANGIVTGIVTGIAITYETFSSSVRQYRRARPPQGCTRRVRGSVLRLESYTSADFVHYGLHDSSRNRASRRLRRP